MTAVVTSTGPRRHGFALWARLSALMWPLIWALFGVAFCASAPAEVPTTPLTGFTHTAWNAKQGAPGVVWSIAQTTDGTLWIASDSGLFRFDGVRFLRVDGRRGLETVSGGFTSLYGARHGGLWMGLRFGGVAFYREGQFSHYPPGNGVPEGSVHGIGEDSEGAVWIATSAGLARLEQGTWHPIGADWGLPENSSVGLVFDRTGTLWIRRSERLFYLPTGTHHFVEIPEARAAETQTGGSAAFLALDRDGNTWVADDRNGVRPISGFTNVPGSQPRSVPDSPGGWPLLFDREGSLWYPPGYGIRRLINPRAFTGERFPTEAPRIERFTAADGLTVDSVTAVFEDREGNIWIGTLDGINRFTPTSVRMVVRTGSSFGVVRGTDGTMWSSQLERNESRLLHFSGDEIIERIPSPYVTCAHLDSRGALWFAGRGKVWRLEGKTLQPQPAPEGTLSVDCQALISEPSGVMWYSAQRKGVFRFKHGKWELNGNLPELPDEPAITLMPDAKGRVWLGYTNGRLAIVDGDTVRLFDKRNGITVGNVSALGSRGDHVWVGGERGLLRFDGEHFMPVRTSGEDPLRELWGVVETEAGELWVAGSAGIVRLSKDQLQQILKDPTAMPKPTIFDYRDGLIGTVQSMRPTPAIVEGGDGRLWFALSTGLGVIDPAHIVRNTLPPPVTIWSLTAAGREYSPFSREVALPVGTRQLQIGYAASSLAVPERVRFRYQLEGLDDSWQDVADRREAIYTNVAPGTYKFRVIASNNDGVWNDQGATLVFTIPPAFYQTTWFYSLCALLLIAVIVLLYRLRLRQATAAMRVRLEDRIVERERIARDLHDTLLQGLQGLILRFQAVSARIPSHEPASEMMERALTRADEVLLESRARVKDLRDSLELRDDLPATLESVGQQLSQESPAAFGVIVEGTARKLHPIVQEEIFMIGREALANAFHHAKARRIEVEIEFRSTELRLKVRDDGRGVEREVLNAGGRSGHFGLGGMRERAEKIRSHLDISSRVGTGTVVELRVPATMAYRRATHPIAGLVPH